MVFVGWGRAYIHSHIILPYKIILLWIYGFYDEHDDDLRKGSKSIYKRNISKEKLSYIFKNQKPYRNEDLANREVLKSSSQLYQQIANRLYVKWEWGEKRKIVGKTFHL